MVPRLIEPREIDFQVEEVGHGLDENAARRIGVKFANLAICGPPRIVIIEPMEQGDGALDLATRGALTPDVRAGALGPSFRIAMVATRTHLRASPPEVDRRIGP